MQEYVCGFLFFKTCDKWPVEVCIPPSNPISVLLIHKTKPDWQKGLFNGIGGKIEEGETPAQAMRREFFEEADIDIDNWTEYAQIIADNYKVFFFKKFMDCIPAWKSKTEERVVNFDANHLPHSLVKSNKFLIPLALQTEFKHSIITESTK